jgi:DNA-binding NtrC family response regulator
MDTSDYKILLVEDENHMIATVELLLGNQYSLRAARSGAEARKLLKEDWPDLLLLDLGLPDESGMSLLRNIRQMGRELEVVVITVSTDVGTAVEVMKLGARDYIQKPFEKEDLLLCVKQAYDHWKLTRELDRLRGELHQPFHFENIVAESPEMVEPMSIARKMAKCDSTVLITGPTGTGKELVARAIHCDGVRRRGPFVAVNCAQFASSLLESELFGHEKGAFTGATRQRKGRFELANGGTLFLDEIGNTSLEMQAKILRVVETKQFVRVGGQEHIDVDVRLIAATNADLEKLMEENRFRRDLYYRLDVVRIELPPLSERKADIAPLCERFLAKHCAKIGREVPRITPEAMEAFQAYGWPGNVREMQNVLEMAMALEETGWITTRYVPPHILACVGQHGEGTGQKPASLLQGAVESFERRFLEEQLRVNGWNRRETARRLGVHRNTVENKMEKYGIQEDE